jgi:GMP synthase (glutamine-hydrolysing)
MASIVVIDNGSQYTHLIKRSFRDLGIDAESINSKEKYDVNRGKIESAAAIVFSGGPNSVYAERSESLSKVICMKVQEGNLKKPLLGICYGHQMIAYVWGGKVEKGGSAEYGMGEITVDEEDALFMGLPKKFRAWVSHFDEVKQLPPAFVVLAHSETCKIEAMKHSSLPIFSVQFHPEVWHTENGEKILKNFLEAIGLGGVKNVV